MCVFRQLVPPVAAVLVTVLDSTASEFVTLIDTTFPVVTESYTLLGTVTVAEVSDVGVTVTSTSIESLACKKFTTRLRLKSLCLIE
jgi:hypothetical protein